MVAGARNTPPGPGVDASGQTAVDPTKNVLDRIGVEVLYQNKLREKDAQHVREVLKLEREHATQLREAEERLRQAESKRLDAIRTVDQGAVAAARAEQTAAATALVATVDRTAEANRANVEAQRASTATALRAEITPLQTAIDSLRQSQAEGFGAKAQTSETRGASGNLGMWLAVGASVVFGLGSTLLATAGLAVTILVATGVIGGP